MLCPKCKKTYPDDWHFCPECSEPLVKEFIPNPKEEKPSNTKRNIKIGVIIAVILILFSSFIGKSSTDKYNDALKLVASGKYSDALKEINSVETTKAKELKAEINKALNPHDTELDLVLKLNDDDIKALQSGGTPREFFSNPDINQYFMNRLAKIDIAQLKAEALKREEDARKQALKDKFIKERLSTWDGSDHELEKYIKTNMNDPKSYEHVETRFSINYKDKTATIITVFRGKNAFGGLIVNSLIAVQDINSGNLISVEKF